MMTLNKSKKIPCLQKCFIPLTPIEITPIKKCIYRKQLRCSFKLLCQCMNCKNDYWVCNYSLNDKYHSRKSGLH